MIDINELRQLVQAATPGPWVAKNTSGAGLEIYMSHPLYPDKDWPAFGTGSAFCKKGLVSYETWTQFPHEVHDAQQAKNALFIAAANPAAITELLDRLEAAEKEIALKERVIDALGSELNAVAKERDALRAKVEAAERQEPVGHVYRHGKDYHGRQWHGIVWYDPNLDVQTGSKLFLLPGAKGEEK